MASRKITSKKEGSPARQENMNRHHSVVIDEEGNLFSCGKNANGQLGTNDLEDRTSFTAISCPAKFMSVALGYQSAAVACAEDGTLWAWCENKQGQTGLPSLVNQH